MSQMTTLPAWWQVMLPHRDIRNNKRLDESIFAADLGQVVRGAASNDYVDPIRFFASTYLTAGLTALLADVLRELSGGGSGNRIIQIETPFGGGKTHTLLALYHLIRHREDVIRRPEIAALLNSIGLRNVPDASVAPIVGTDLSTVEAEQQPDGTQIHTLWGHLAYELGGKAGYERIRRADEKRVAPGANVLRELLATGPAKLILMDELVNYIVPAGAITVGTTTLKDQTIAFLQQLTQAVAHTPRAMLLLTIPGSQTELYGQAAKDLQQQVFTAASQTAEVVGRVQTVRTPVQGDDIYEVLRRRLLEQPVSDAAREERERKARTIARAYVQMYRESPQDFPQEVQEQAYIERMVRAYPFHPDVVRVLYERWGTLPDFQRTRGALRILGMTLADLFANNSHEPIILPSHLNLVPGDLRNELVRVLDNSAFNNVLDSDIAGPGAKAVEIDNAMGREHGRFRPAVRTATTIFLWSFSGGTSLTKGANEAQIRAGVLSPDMQGAIVGNVLNEFRRRLWYLHEENNTYRFDTQANLNRVIVQKEESVNAQTARAFVEEQVKTLVTAPTRRNTSGPLFSSTQAPGDARPYLFPRNSQDVADIASVGIVVLRPSQHAPDNDSITDLPPIVNEIMHRYGERPRQYRNTLVVLVPDAAQVTAAEKSARRLLALKAAAADTQLTLPDHQREELRHQIEAATDAFPQEVGRIYRTAVVSASQEEGGMKRLRLGSRPYVKGATLWDDAFALLASEERYLTTLAPSLLANNYFGIWPRGVGYVSTQKLWDAFTQFPHLPMLAGKHVLVNSIATGCDGGVLGYAVGDAEGPPFAAGRFGKHNSTLQVDIAPTSWLLTAEEARKRIIPKSDPVREIPPELLIDPAMWPSGSQRRPLASIWAAIENHYAPRSVDGLHVLSAALHAGVAQGFFRVSINSGEPGTDLSGIDITRLRNLNDIELVRTTPPPPERPRFLEIDVRNVDPTHLSKIMTGVIVPLRNQGASVTLRLVIDADAPEGIAPEVMELTIKETFKQLGLTPDYKQSG
jgi:hypothetical protein